MTLRVLLPLLLLLPLADYGEPSRRHHCYYAHARASVAYTSLKRPLRCWAGFINRLRPRRQPLVVQSSAGSGPTAPAPLRAVVALEQGAVDHVAHIADLHSTATETQHARSSRTATA